MYLWNRRFTLDTGRWAEGVGAIMASIEVINSASSYRLDAWMPASIGPANTMALSARTEAYAPFAEENAARLSDPDVLAAIAAAGPCITEVEDTLARIVHVAGERGDVPAVFSAISWQAHPHDLKAAIGWAVEMAEHVYGVHGHPTFVGSSQWGRPNGLMIGTSYESLAEFEAASDAIQAEGSFLDRIQNAVGMAETIESAVMRRVT
ncbi:MAG: hypothetical protein VYC56_09095 [Actinomycetota bacterium]|mgnify:CR=1 FL=1|nr:hypothetical protein [Actinomycetota bacterium]MED6327842.1 hypothetical protein [Actinomycetota bacterium]